MSFITLVESEIRSLKMTKEQKRVVKDLASMDWEITEGESDNPIAKKPGTDVQFEITESGQMKEIVK